MTTKSSPRVRWVSFIGLLMLLFASTPAGLAAQTGLAPVGDVAQSSGMGIELLLVDCPPGSPADPSDLVPGCTDGREGININVSSVDPNLGVNLPKVSVKPSNPGPGVINTGPLALGQYRVEIQLPVEDNSFFFECRVRGSQTNDVPVTPDPNGAPNVFLVDNNADADVVCQAWITPRLPNPTMEITYRECDRSDFPRDSRAYADLRDTCTTVSTDPPTFNVRNITDANNQPVTEHQLDLEGKLELTLTPGNYELFTDLDMDEYGEYLFCEYEGQPLYEKEFHETRGITTFTNLLPGEEFTCYWFGVSAGDDADDTADAPDTGDVDDVNTGEAVQNQANDQTIQPQQEGEVAFNIAFNQCTRGDLAGDDRSFGQLDENCTYFEAPGPTFTITEGDGATSTLQPDANGMLTFNHAPVDFSIQTDLDVNNWGQYLFCTVDGGERYSKPFSGAVNGFTNLIAGEQINCDWFAVNASFEPTETDEVVDPAPSLARFDLDLIACESAEAVSETSSLDAFRANCNVGVENMVFNLVDQNENHRGGVTLPTGEAVIADVPAGDWRLWSDIPLEAATEYYFCSIDGGTYTALTLSDRGVASFPGVDGQQVHCEIYVVPENLRDDPPAGASVEVHLSLCPNNYEGSSWYGDCHDNGLGDMPFTLTGPAGEVEGTTAVERTPGPGIVRFTALPAGEYVLAGGPPQHDGTVFLYCSDPSTGNQVTTTFDGMGRFTLAENQSIVCDWYFTPTGQAPDPEPEPERAEIFTTMFICPPGVNVAGSGFSQLDSACTERLNNVPMTLQSPGGVPITANTGASGDGAVRFYDLLGGDYVLTPKLPAEYVSAAVYCDLNGGDVYQKALANGATTFVNVEGELISCSWFVTAKPQQAAGPTGSITIREMLCEGDRSTITDWERECQPGSSGVSFTITSSGGGVTQTLSPNAEGVAVFTGLPNEYYDVKQSEGAWCRAQAERVDSRSRVIVSGGGNTDLFIYQCNQQIGLPDTGTGPMGSEFPMQAKDSLVLGAAALPMFAIAAWQIRRWHVATNGVVEPVQIHSALTRTRDGYRYR